VLEGEPEPQPVEGHAAILSLAPPLRPLCRNARRPVNEHDGGLGLVSVLAAGTGAFGPGLAAGFQEFSRGKRRRVSRRHGAHVTCPSRSAATGGDSFTVAVVVA